jgi:hypothetical protein
MMLVASRSWTVDKNVKPGLNGAFLLHPWRISADPGAGQLGDTAGDHAAATGADREDVVEVLEEKQVGDFGGVGFGVDAGAEGVATLGAAIEGGGENGVAGGAEVRGQVLPDPAALVGAV